MIILYTSYLNTNIAAGLNWSVPASVDAQSKIDNVMWINMTQQEMPHWKQVDAYHNIEEFGGLLELDRLPHPFDKPDAVVFEGLYWMKDVKLARTLRKKRIPYIIVPRSSLTNQAMHNHAWLKKWFAHLLIFDRFVKRATAIQYLTEQEANDSIGRFKTPHFIVPNGFATPKEQKQEFNKDGITASFIGRLDIYQKGLDLLLEAISDMNMELVSANFHLNIYGPRRYDFYKIQDEINKRKIAEVVSLHDEVGGEEKKIVLLNTDVFIMTSRFEGHPMGLIEALAYGIPCLVTPGTNMIKEINDADAGWSCEGNIFDIKQTLIKVVSQNKLLPHKGQNARLLSLNYNWNKLAENFHNELERILLTK